MHVPPAAPVSFVNAQIGGELTSLRVEGVRISSLGEGPLPGDTVVNLRGDQMFPGLINAHDHLQLNSLPEPAAGKSYRNVRDWIADVDAHRRSDAEFKSRVAIERDERLIIGGMKNLLSGVTTVAHHDPFYAYLSNSQFPTGVLRDYGWSHSLYMDGEDGVVKSFRSTPSEWPWIIHAAEGVDDDAAQEFERLDALGCLGSNTLLVHGVALQREHRVRLDRAGAGLIWCPSSNLRLFGKTADVSELTARGRVAIGTDSRLSGARDLLEELGAARECAGFDDRTLALLATRDAARLLRLTDRGVLRPGARADILILPAAVRISAAGRADVSLVLIDGQVRYGNHDLARRAAPQVDWAEVRVDGKQKVLDPGIAALLAHARAMEPGFEISTVTGRAA